MNISFETHSVLVMLKNANCTDLKYLKYSILTFTGLLYILWKLNTSLTYFWRVCYVERLASVIINLFWLYVKNLVPIIIVWIVNDLLYAIYCLEIKYCYLKHINDSHFVHVEVIPGMIIALRHLNCLSLAFSTLRGSCYCFHI